MIWLKKKAQEVANPFSRRSACCKVRKMKAKKELGQNFLTSTAVAKTIATAVSRAPGELVLEIGPGKGVLTQELLTSGARVVAVEKDRELIPVLEERFAEEISLKNLTLLEGDVRDGYIDTIKEPYHVVANIPYYLTGELIRMLLEATNQPKSMTLLVQKEVAERICGRSGGSILGMSVAIYGTPKLLRKVSRGLFSPAPKVDSAILVITDISRERLGSISSERFFSVLKAGFAHKRKVLVRNLEELLDRETVLSTLVSLGHPKTARAEELSLNDWKTLSSIH
jgi:16S rRNA (adenine1518-N6/adenine1519-N6)-dimethyltransferase